MPNCFWKQSNIQHQIDQNDGLCAKQSQSKSIEPHLCWQTNRWLSQSNLLPVFPIYADLCVADAIPGEVRCNQDEGHVFSVFSDRMKAVEICRES